MAKDQMIDIDTVVRLLGVTKTSLEVYKSSLPGFPEGIGKKGCAKLYSRNAILSWRKTHDIRALINELSRARYRRRNPMAETHPITGGIDHDLCLRWARGEFMPPSQRQQIEMKKLIARNFGKGITQRVTVVADWRD